MGATVQSNNIIHTVSCYAEGEVGDVITAGVPTPPGDTLWQQQAWIAADNLMQLWKFPAWAVSRSIQPLAAIVS